MYIITCTLVAFLTLVILRNYVAVLTETVTFLRVRQILINGGKMFGNLVIPLYTAIRQALNVIGVRDALFSDIIR